MSLAVNRPARDTFRAGFIRVPADWLHGFPGKRVDLGPYEQGRHVLIPIPQLALMPRRGANLS
jgi:hypothetical protein